MVAGAGIVESMGNGCLDKRTMTIGVPKEVKKQEHRVGLTPASALELMKHGHHVIIQADAGTGSGFSDEAYRNVGCSIFLKPADIYENADMIIKVKEPLPEEYPFIRVGQILFTYFHFAASKELTEAMIKSCAVCIAYETVKCQDGSLPLLVPMSEIAGRMAVQEAAKYLEKPLGGSGVLLGGVPGVRRGKVVVLGGGIVGVNAAKIAAGMGADVTIMDVNVNRLRQLESILPSTCRTLYSSSDNITEELKEADAVVGGVLIPGAKAPKLVTKNHLKMMKKGSVVIDVAVDQGGCIETCVPTTHDNPTFIVEGVVHYCVANMPGAVPFTATNALNNATISYAVQIANFGWVEACRRNKDLAQGLNIVQGYVTCEGVCDAFNLPYCSPADILMNNTTNLETGNKISGKKMESLESNVSRCSIAN